MKKIIIWLLTAQKFLFGFAVIFGAIPVTYALSDTIFDHSFFTFLFGITVYVLCVVPLAYALGIGYDRLIERITKKNEIQAERITTVEKASGLSFKVQEEDDEIVIVEKETQKPSD